MTDVFDRASEREQELRDDALQDQRRRAGLAGKTYTDSARECHVCDEPIPDARRRAIPGVQTCVDCQAEVERALP
ncbi:MAG: TraR/DksA family transcriptional regulator [Rhodocyclaceae bacterium]|nr:TraR/DksA family transcriptional regulator [Rhodocyclaceae bacterium]